MVGMELRLELTPVIEQRLEQKLEPELRQKTILDVMIPEGTIVPFTPSRPDMFPKVNDEFQKDTDTYYDYSITEKRDPLLMKHRQEMPVDRCDDRIVCFMAVNNGRNNYSLVQLPIFEGAIQKDSIDGCLRDINRFREGEAVHALNYISLIMKNIFPEYKTKVWMEEDKVTRDFDIFIKIKPPLVKTVEKTIDDFGNVIELKPQKTNQKDCIIDTLSNHFDIIPNRDACYEMIAYENLNSMLTEEDCTRIFR